MDLRESSRNYGKRDVEKSSDMKGNRVGDEEDSDGNEKRKYRSSKPRKHVNVEESEEWDSSERKRSSGDRLESRKRSSFTSRIGSGDEDEYDTERDLRSKQLKRSQDEKSERKLSSGYQERETDSNRKNRDASGTKGHGTADESEKELLRKSGSKLPVHESSQSKSRSKMNNSYDIEQEKIEDRDSRYTERKESSREKGHTSRETEKNLRRRLDDADSDRKGKESHYADRLDSRSENISDKYGKVYERTLDTKSEPLETKSRDGDPNMDKAIKSSNGEEKRIDGENTRSRGRPQAHEEDYKLGSMTREERAGGPRDDKLQTIRDKPSSLFGDTESVTHKPSIRDHGEKIEIHRHLPNPAHGVRDISETRERSANPDENEREEMRNRSGREVEHSKMPWSPERRGRHHPQSGDPDSDNERSISLKEKEREREIYRDDRSKGCDSSWSDKNKDHEGYKGNWRRKHETNNDKDRAYVVVDYDHNIEWDARRQGGDRNDNRFHNYPGYRKTGRNEGAKSSYGTANRSSDMIEIRPNSMDYGREASGSVFTGRKFEGGPHTDFQSTTGNDQLGHSDDTRMTDIHCPGDNLKDKYPDDNSSAQDQNSGRSNTDMHGENLRGLDDFATSNRSGPNLSGGSQPPSGNFNRITPQGAKGGRLGRGGRGRPPGRNGQGGGIQLPMMGPPFGPPVFPPGPMQTLGPNMSPIPGPPMGPGVFIPPYPGPNVWPGARAVDMNMLSVPHGLSSIPHGPSQHRFPPNVVTGPNPNMYYNQQGSARGVSPNISGPGFNTVGPMGRGFPNDKALGGWSPRTSGTPGKAPSRGEQNDYSQNFVDTGMRPQNYIRELLELTNSVEDYPKLRELIQRKDEIVAKASTPPMYYKCDLREFVLSSEFFGTKFDVILVDPPWEEYVHRAPGVADQMDYWTFEEISNLKIEAIADTPSFIFLWVGDGVGLEQGRQCLRKWGFRRCEDICWVKTNKSNTSSGLRHDSHTLFQHSKEHCLMGIKGTVRRSTDGHVIHANIDTDIVIAEEPPYGSTKKPEDLYRIIEHFSLGRRRIELFGEDHNIRSGWLTVGKELSSSNFNAEAYNRNFCDKDGKVWQGGSGRNPPPGAPHLIVTTPEIEGLRPKSPPPKNQQQQLPMPLPQTATINVTNRRPGANSPQTPTTVGLFQEHSSSNPSTPAQWTPSMTDMKAPDTVGVVTDDKVFDGYGFDPTGVQTNGDNPDFVIQGASNMM